MLSHLDLARRRRVLIERLRCWEPELEQTIIDDDMDPLDLPPQTPSADLRILLRARDGLLADLRRPPKLDDLAAEACTNRTTLGRLFKQHLGMTVFDYLREQRLQQARRLLASTGASVVDIAGRIGYRYARDFAAAFKQRFGVTPAAYRQAVAEQRDSPTSPAAPLQRNGGQERQAR